MKVVFLLLIITFSTIVSCKSKPDFPYKKRIIVIQTKTQPTLLPLFCLGIILIAVISCIRQCLIFKINHISNTHKNTHKKKKKKNNKQVYQKMYQQTNNMMSLADYVQKHDSPS